MINAEFVFCQPWVILEARRGNLLCPVAEREALMRGVRRPRRMLLSLCVVSFVVNLSAVNKIEGYCLKGRKTKMMKDNAERP